MNVSSRATLKINEKTVTNQGQFQYVETPRDSLGVNNTTETLEQKKNTSWTPMGQETDKCPAPTD